MRSFINEIAGGIIVSLSQFGIKDIIDIFLVAILIYYLLILFRQTRAMQLIKGIGIILLASVIIDMLRLNALSWILSEVIKAGGVALVVIFQPEMRSALEKLGRARMIATSDSNNLQETIAEELANAMINLSKRQVGSLIIIERKTGLADIISSGVKIDALISSAMIEQIFEPNTPLHDGAVIIEGDRIIAAGCFLPLSNNNTISKQLGTRHRAALGISEVSDCLAFVVSEESGVISVSQSGKLTRFLDADAIKHLIIKQNEENENDKKNIFTRIKQKIKKINPQNTNK